MHAALWGSGIPRPWASPQWHTRSWWSAAGRQQYPELLGSWVLKHCSAGQAGVSRGVPGRVMLAAPGGRMVAEGGTQPPLQPAGQQLWVVLGVLAFEGSTRKHGPCQPFDAPSTGRPGAACGQQGTHGAPLPCPCSCSGWVPNLRDPSLPEVLAPQPALPALWSPQDGHAGDAGVAQQGGWLGCGQG